MRRNKDAQILEHMIAYCDDIICAVERFAGGKEQFASDRVFRNACAMPLMQIGELAKSLTDGIICMDTTIPWKEIKGMRDYFAHEYHEMDVDIIWNTIEDIPNFKNQCVQLREQIQDKQQ